ncbi:MSHA biogenesis protein MshQ [Geopseudomonas sagittaria]|uniref:MSHA biogenesis protein MshQ n=1 Tax=Geopseudomonas sagittaria TaxID=1135990 RepID=A0A1I5WLC3_9GAMM|nr:DUF6701 domain-containing protein [Pseudomonas sagittaria]SFQ20166.1 MSHA biogenesis protein MshQ [Pseudomonas sagittaria]
MRRLRGWLVACLCALAMTGSPAAWAVLCSEVFFPGPAGDGLNAYVPPLSLEDFDASTRPVLTAASPRTVPVSDSYWAGGISPNGWILTAPTAGTARVYVKGDLFIGNNAEINKNGNPRNLIIIVMGNLDIQNSNNTRLNALIYVTGNVTIGNNPAIYGGVSAVGSLQKGNNIVYDSSALAGADFGALCDNPDSVGQIDHFRFLHAATGLTCSPLDVTLKACADATCSRLYEGSVSLTLSPTSWAPGNVVTFNSGQAALKLHGNMPGYVALGVTSAVPAANNPRQCSTADCRVLFHDSGFVFDVPHLLAAKAQTGIVLQAVRKDATSQTCVPAFGPATRTLQFWSDYVDPGAGSMKVQVNDTAIGNSAASPTALPLVFDSEAKTQLKVRYDDAGKMRLNAQYVGTGVESGLTMLGSDEFVSKPYGLHISTPADSTCSTASVAGCAALSVAGVPRAAGDSFPLTIRAVAWQADGEALTEAALSDNPTTPNFQLNGIALNSTLVEPSAASGGVAGAFYRHAVDGSRQAALTSYDHAVGASTTLQVGQSEVGIYRITATPPAYLLQTIGGGESALIGRFTPAYLGVTSTASLTPACGAFSYQGQSINFAGGQPGIVVTGYNRQGAVTNNYDRGSFWNWPVTDPSRYPPTRQPYSFSDASKPGLVARLQSLGDAQSLVISDSGGADGSRAFDWRAEGVRQADALLWQLPSPPTAEDLPFVLTSAGTHVQLKLLAGQLSDADGICYRGSDGSAAACEDFVHAFGGTELRLGRLRIDAASGPENQGLDLPYWLESWQTSAGGPVFGATTGDTCSTQAALGQVVLSGFIGDLLASHFPTPPGMLEAASGTPLATGVIRLPAPNHKGSALVSLSGLNGTSPVLPWLLYDWDDDSNTAPEAPSARATFGVLSSQRALIFRREVYR